MARPGLVSSAMFAPKWQPEVLTCRHQHEQWAKQLVIGNAQHLRRCRTESDERSLSAVLRAHRYGRQ